jgi:hypothetical protein
MEKTRKAYKILVRKSERERDFLEDLGIGRRIILKWILQGRMGECRLGSLG